MVAPVIGEHCGIGSTRVARVLLKVKLAPLLGYASQHRMVCEFQPIAIVADHQLHTLHAPGRQVFEKGPPVRSGFAQGNRDPQDLPLTCLSTPLAIKTAASWIRPSNRTFSYMAPR